MYVYFWDVIAPPIGKITSLVRLNIKMKNMPKRHENTTFYLMRALFYSGR